MLPRNPAGEVPAENHMAKRLRDYCFDAGLRRPQIHNSSARRIALRARDLRATFVTIKLGIGKSERWVMDRTGHSSSIMLNRYYRKEQWEYGDLTPLVEAIPELGDGEE